ncbi:PAS domain S-box protein [Herbaspirillum lusitanum]|uniref:sensor histidine kinase n=1 Tax=Herbaspirillum lusitanum TaxID=213312 RepID=UPI002238927C|nr:ATP-binding protein [Herbaspirillum lusitanum]MCW5298827.1 PAS domain S-box protein [Herbaspirillum lusitanum]
MPRSNKRESKNRSALVNTGAFFVLAMLLSIGVATMAYRSVRVFEARAIWVEHTHTVLQRLEETHSTLRDLVANALGYALSSRHEYLLGFESDRNLLHRSLSGLRALLIDNQDQLDRLNDLSISIAQRIELARALIEADKELRIDNAHEHGRDLSADIRRQFVALKDVEQALLAERSAETRESIRWTILAIVGGSVVIVAILIAVYLRLKRETLRRLEAQAKTQLYADEIEDLYNRAPCGYHSIDEESGLIVQINDTELAWLGYMREQVVGKMTQADLMTPSSAERYRTVLRPRFLRNEAIDGIDADCRRADGTHFPTLMSISTVLHPDNGRVISRNVIHDISGRKQTEREIEELNASLKRQAQHLSNINKELESFSYSVSHDLRAPLRAISGYAMMVEEDYADALDAKGQELLQVIRRNVSKMDALISDLLKLSKSATGELTLGYFSMRKQVEQSIAGLRRENAGVEFIVDPLEDVIANQVLLSQVWENLLGNAVKFSKKAEHAVVRVSSTSTPEEVIYQVQDNGIGFDMRYVQKLFGTFQRLHRQEDYAGAGIGLALVQRIVVRHGGRVWAESRSGEGASFYFALPRQGQ